MLNRQADSSATSITHSSNSVVSKQTIAELIWNVESFHGLVLSAKICDENDPDAAINAKFEDFVWLQKIKESKPFKTFNDLPPVLPYKARIQIWRQGKKGRSPDTYTDPVSAFQKFESLLETSNARWEDVSVVWSSPENQPHLAEDIKNKPTLASVSFHE